MFLVVRGKYYAPFSIDVVNLILGGDPTSEELQLADLNGDGTLNILDIVAIVNIILSS